MIQPQELRLGNLVYSLGYDFNEGGKFLDGTKEIITVDIDYLKDILENPEYYEPIQLSEEILLKFGYIGNEPTFSEISTIFTNGIHKIWKPFNKFLDDTYRFEINYAHQLQNLYFALKGEELQFKQIS